MFNREVAGLDLSLRGSNPEGRARSGQGGMATNKGGL